MAADIVFRQAKRADVPTIVRLLADDVLGAGRETADDTLPHRYWTAFDAIEQAPNVEQWVAERGGSVIACLQLYFLPGLSLKGGMRAQIEAVRVASDLRGGGIGARFVGMAIDRARDRGCVLIQLTTNKQRDDARRFYENLGFQATHEGMKLSLS
ncbi:MAG: GNAT family N-acetyltransferase [Pseudomonadota bacterium]